VVAWSDSGYGAIEERVSRIGGLELQRGARLTDADILLIAVDEADPDLIRWLVRDVLDEPMPVLLVVDEPSTVLARMGSLERMLWFGIGGIVLGSASDQELADSVHLVIRRCTVLPEGLVDDSRLSGGGMTMPARWAAADARGALGELTTRERDVLRLVGLGRSNGEIASDLWLSENTVRSHLRRLQGKLGLRDRTEVIIFAQELGVAEPS